jgi:beta-phosphoglucomutase-like phosphatase (HAD superfamily)
MSADINEPEALMRFMEGLKQAAGSAHILAHAQQNPGWLKIRDLLEATRAQGTKMAVRTPLSRQAARESIDAYARHHAS